MTLLELAGRTLNAITCPYKTEAEEDLTLPEKAT